MNKEKLLLRIKSKVNILESGCHEWTGSKRDVMGKYFYGQCWFDGRAWLAHKFFWEQVNGPVPNGLEIDHKCRNKLCVNVDHLRAVTHKENCLNREICDQTHCKCGNEFTRMVSGYRICKVCRDARVRSWRERNRDRYNAISRKSYLKCKGVN